MQATVYAGSVPTLVNTPRDKLVGKNFVLSVVRTNQRADRLWKLLCHAQGTSLRLECQHVKCGEVALKSTHPHDDEVLISGLSIIESRQELMLIIGVSSRDAASLMQDFDEVCSRLERELVEPPKKKKG